MENSDIEYKGIAILSYTNAYMCSRLFIILFFVIFDYFIFYYFDYSIILQYDVHTTIDNMSNTMFKFMMYCLS